MKQGMRFLIENGKAIDAWAGPWLPTSPPRAPRPRGTVSRTNLNEWIKSSPTEWDREMIQRLVIPEDVEEIMKLRLCNHQTHDLLG